MKTLILFGKDYETPVAVLLLESGVPPSLIKHGGETYSTDDSANCTLMQYHPISRGVLDTTKLPDSCFLKLLQ